MKIIHQVGFVFASLAISIAIVGCARVRVVKVPSDQRKAEEVEGFRYYLPRPYLVVKKAFPVAGEEAFVWGTVKDNNVVELDSSTLNSGLRSFFPGADQGKPVTLNQNQIKSALDTSAVVGESKFSQHATGSGNSKATGNMLDLTSSLSGSVTPSLIRACPQGRRRA